MTTFKRIIALFILSVVCFGQNYTTPIFVFYQESVLAAAAEVVTIRKPAGTSKTVRMKSAYIACSVACTFTIEVQGTWSAGTTITPTKTSSIYPASTMAVTYATTIASTTQIFKYSLTAGQDKTLDLSDMYLVATADAITIRTSSMTGTVQIGGLYQEQN